jgi:hypothetical protein
MTAEQPAATESAVVDEARSAAEGTRVASRWLASALGAIPSLAILGAIVRAPGDAGFDPTELALGVGLAALGALIGVLAFARVIAPVPLEDKDLETLNLTRIPGQPYATFERLRESLEAIRGAAVDDEFAMARALRAAKTSDASAARLQARAVEAEEAAKADPSHQAAAERAKHAHSDADRARSEADAKAADAAAQQAGHEVWAEQFTRTEAIRSDAYGLKASDEVRLRFRDAQIAAVFAVALIAAGVVLVGLAPIEKSAESPASLVTLTLNDAGRTALGCPRATTLQALRIRGTDATPKVITFPVPGCPAKTLTFATEQKPLGTVAADKAAGSGG